MSDQPEKNRTSRDAELEALRQKSLVGTQRASLGSATLPEGMTLDKWMMQQRNFTEEERRKRNDAAKFLHSYREKNVPVGTTPPSKMTSNRMEHIPPGPDAPQVTEIPNADIKGIVAEFEKITTTTTTKTTSPPRHASSNSTRTTTTTSPDGGGVIESEDRNQNTTDTTEKDYREEEEDKTEEITNLSAPLAHQEESSAAQLRIQTESPPTEEKEREEEVVQDSSLPEENEEENISTANDQGLESSLNEESYKIVDEPSQEQILPLDETTDKPLEESKTQLPLKTSKEDPQDMLIPQPPNDTIVSSDLPLQTDNIDAITAASTTINDYSTTIDQPTLEAKQQDLSLYDKNPTNDHQNSNDIMVSRPIEEVNKGGSGHDADDDNDNDNDNNNIISNTDTFAIQSIPKVGSTKQVHVKVLLAVHVKKDDADAVLSGRKQSILDSVIHVTENIVKKTIASSTLLDATGTFYNSEFRPTIDSVEADDETKTDGGKVVTRLIIRIVVPLFQLSNALKNDKKQVINEVSEALKKAVSDGRFAKEAKAFRKGKVTK